MHSAVTSAALRHHSDATVSQGPPNSSSASQLPRDFGTEQDGVERSSSVSSKASDFLRQSMSSFSAMRQTVPVEAIARSLWKPPTMHAGSERGGGDQGRVAAKEEPHRAEEWYELFYDLVFVASAIQIGYILKYKVEINRLWTCTMLFLVLKATWDQLMLYQNRYDTKDLLHHGFYMLEAMTAFVMCLSLGTNEETKNWDEDVEMPHFAIAAAISRVLLSAMYSQILTLPGPHRTYIRTVAVAKIISAGLLVASAAMGTSQGNFYYVWIAALLVERPVVHLTVFFATAKGNQSYRVPQHTTHLIYRQATFVLLVLGEAVIQLVQSHHGKSVEDYCKALMGFGIIFNLGDVYYQQQIVGLHNDIRFRPNYMWSYLHMLLSLLVLFFAVGLKLQFSESNKAFSYTESVFMCVSCSASLIVIFTLRMLHKGVMYKGKRVRRLAYVVRFLLAGLCGLVPLWARTSTQTVAFLFAITLVIVIQDVFSHRGFKYFATEEDGHGIAHDNGTIPSGNPLRDPIDVASANALEEALIGFDDASFGRDDFIRQRATIAASSKPSLVVMPPSSTNGP